jgi:hypothetical protein
MRLGVCSALAAAFTVGGWSLAQRAETAEPRGLLAFAGQEVKWGAPTFGVGANLSYAFLDRPRSRPSARNCAEMVPLRELLDRSRIRPAAFEHEVEAAFAVWAAIADIAFHRIDRPEEADILIGASVGSRGVAYTNVERGRNGAAAIVPLTESSICLDPSERWELVADGDPRSYVVRRVMAHEIGHAIGLDHYGRDGGIMGYAYIEGQRGEASVRLSPLDIAPIQLLYGPVSDGQAVAARRPDDDACDVMGAMMPVDCDGAIGIEPAAD